MQIRCRVFLTMQTLADNRLCVFSFGSLFEYGNVAEGGDGRKEAEITPHSLNPPVIKKQHNRR